MGTRADFYIGRGLSAKWIGSIAWDGYPDAVVHKNKDSAANGILAAARTELDFTSAISLMSSERDDFTRPEDGWPWPWETSHTTDYAYAWDEDKLWISCFGGPWMTIQQEKEWSVLNGTEQDEYEQDEYEHDVLGHAAVFPDMTSKKNVTLGKRSGLMVVSSK